MARCFSRFNRRLPEQPASMKRPGGCGRVGSCSGATRGASSTHADRDPAPLGSRNIPGARAQGARCALARGAGRGCGLMIEGRAGKGRSRHSCRFNRYSRACVKTSPHRRADPPHEVPKWRDSRRRGGVKPAYVSTPVISRNVSTKLCSSCRPCMAGGAASLIPARLLPLATRLDSKCASARRRS
jgi:hypothetical protein